MLLYVDLKGNARVLWQYREGAVTFTAYLHRTAATLP
jgi:hypothetical protein